MSIINGTFGRVDSDGNGDPTNGATVRLWPDNAAFLAAVGGSYPAQGTAIPDAGVMLPTATVTSGVAHGSTGAYRFSGVVQGDWWVSMSYSTDDVVWEHHSIDPSMEAPATDDILYVSYANGLDTNTGRSEGTALKTIQAAIDALGATGGIIRLTPGGHTITAAISVATTNDLTIQGMGMNKTLIDVNADISALTVSGVCNRITLKDFTISSGTARTAGKYGISVIGTVGVHTGDFHIQNVAVYNMPSPIYTRYAGGRMENVKVVSSIVGAVTGHGVHCANGAGIRLRDVTVAGSNTSTLALDGDGFRIDSDTDTVLLDGCESYNVLGAGFAFRNSLAGTTGPRLVRIHNCWSEGAQARGYDVDTGIDIRFNGCHAAQNAGTGGYVVSGGDSITFSDCLATANLRDGFYIAGGDGVKIDGCTASNNSIETPATYDGIRIAAGVTHVRITNNRSGDFIYTVAGGGDQKYGIDLVAGASDYLFIANNDLEGNVTAGMLNSSTGTNNVIRNDNTHTTDAAFAGTVGVTGAVDLTNALDLNSATLGLRLPAIAGDTIHGTATMTGASTTTVVSNTAVKTGALIIITPTTTNWYNKEPYVSSISNGVSFTITHLNDAATPGFNYWIINPVA